MNPDVFAKQFEDIEVKVEQLAQRCREKDATTKQLSDRIEKLEEELQRKREAEQRYSEERAMIRQRVDQLLVRLQNIVGGEKP